MSKRLDPVTRFECLAALETVIFLNPGITKTEINGELRRYWTIPVTQTINRWWETLIRELKDRGTVSSERRGKQYGFYYHVYDLPEGQGEVCMQRLNRDCRSGLSIGKDRPGTTFSGDGS